MFYVEEEVVVEPHHTDEELVPGVSVVYIT